MSDTPESKKPFEIRKLGWTSVPDRHSFCLLVGKGVFAADCVGGPDQLFVEAGCISPRTPGIPSSFGCAQRRGDCFCRYWRTLSDAVGRRRLV